MYHRLPCINVMCNRPLPWRIPALPAIHFAQVLGVINYIVYLLSLFLSLSLTSPMFIMKIRGPLRVEEESDISTCKACPNRALSGKYLCRNCLTEVAGETSKELSDVLGMIKKVVTEGMLMSVQASSSYKPRKRPIMTYQEEQGSEEDSESETNEPLIQSEAESDEDSTH